MVSKSQILYTNQVEKLVNLLKGILPIRCSWIFERKTNFEGQVNYFKENWVIKADHPSQRLNMMRCSLQFL